MTETVSNIRNKLARGKFNAVFHLQMSERNWGIIAAAGLGVVSFSAVGGFMLATQTHSQHEKRVASDSAARDKGRQPQQADMDHAGVPTFAERIISNPDPSDGTEREKRDLAAQENTAAWAFWIVILAAIQAALSAAGILFIVRSLRQAEAALKHAREVSHTDFRPWIEINVEPYIGYNNPYQVSFFCFATLRNLGRTPAQDVRVSTTAAPIPVTYYKKYCQPDRYLAADGYMERWQPIQPGGEVTLLISFEVRWEDADPPYTEGEDRHMCPYFGVHVMYSLGGEGEAETVATFQIGLPKPDNPRDVLSFAESIPRELTNLRVRPGVRGKIT